MPVWVCASWTSRIRYSPASRDGLVPPLVSDLPDDLFVRRAPLHTFPYHVAYLVEHDTTHVLAITHDHCRPNYWRDRAE